MISKLRLYLTRPVKQHVENNWTMDELQMSMTRRKEEKQDQNNNLVITSTSVYSKLKFAFPFYNITISQWNVEADRTVTAELKYHVNHVRIVKEVFR